MDEDEVLRDRGAPDEVLVGVQFGEDDLGEEALRARGGGVRVGDLARECGARPSIQTSGWSANGVGRHELEAIWLLRRDPSRSHTPEGHGGRRGRSLRYPRPPRVSLEGVDN